MALFLKSGKVTRSNKSAADDGVPDVSDEPVTPLPPPPAPALPPAVGEDAPAPTPAPPPEAPQLPSEPPVGTPPPQDAPAPAPASDDPEPASLEPPHVEKTRSPSPAPAPPPLPDPTAIKKPEPWTNRFLGNRKMHDMVDGQRASELATGLRLLQKRMLTFRTEVTERKAAISNDLDTWVDQAIRYAMGKHDGDKSGPGEKTRFLFTGDETGIIIKWDLNWCLPVRQIKIPDEVRCLVFDEEKDRLYAGTLDLNTTDGNLWTFDATTGEVLSTIKSAHNLAITELVLGPAACYLYSSSYDGRVHQWTLPDLGEPKTEPTRYRTLARGHGPIHTIALHKPTSKAAHAHQFLLTGGTDGRIRAWNLAKDGVQAFTFEGHRTPVESIFIKDDTMYSGSDGFFTHNLNLALGWNIIQAHDLSDKDGESGVARLTSQYGNVGEWSFQALLLFIEVMQLVSFGFVTPIPWNSELLVEIIAAFQTLLFNFPNVDYVLELAAAGVAVLLFLFIFLSQERLERAKFMKTSSPRRDDWLQYAWILVSASIKLFSRPAFLPLMRVLVKTASCQAMNVEAEAIQTDTCYQGVHLIYIGAAALFVLLYLPAVTRLGLVLGELDNVEVKRNVFDWSEDRLEPKVGHPLSYTVHATKYFGLTLFAKTVLLVVTVMIAPNSEAIVTPDQLLFVSWVLIAVGVAITPVTYLYPPFFSDRACAIRSALDIGVAWTYVCSLVAVLIAERGDVNQTAVLYLAAGITPLMLISYFVYMAWARRRRARVVMGGEVADEPPILKPSYKAPDLAVSNGGFAVTKKGFSKSKSKSAGPGPPRSKSAPTDYSRGAAALRPSPMMSKRG